MSKTKIQFVMLMSSLLLVAGQSFAVPAHLPRPGRTAVEHQMDAKGKAHAAPHGTHKQPKHHK